MNPLVLALLLSIFLHVFALFLPRPGQEVGAREARGAFDEAGGVSGRLVIASPAGREMKRTEPSPRPEDAGRNESNHVYAQRQAGHTAEYGAYYPSEVLTLRPVPLSEVHLEEEFILSVWPVGPAVLSLWIESDGRVSWVEIEASEYPEKLTEALRAAFGKLRFRPGEVDGLGVPVLLRIEANYGPASDIQSKGL